MNIETISIFTQLTKLLIRDLIIDIHLLKKLPNLNIISLNLTHLDTLEVFKQVLPSGIDQIKFSYDGTKISHDEVWAFRKWADENDVFYVECGDINLTESQDNSEIFQEESMETEP